ncbi:hypothetical protein [Rhodococcus sp. KRD162]|uniref:hypothetical protein n=1 Tax=Rhodococcus sp. KRD162 TaxID=2729725 RepID=UPI0019D04BD7|nr:hypothetical protein [Rhodococcus sp. KRD162]
MPIDHSQPLTVGEFDDPELEHLGDRFDELDYVPATDVVQMFGQILYIRHQDLVVIPTAAASLDMIRCQIVRTRKTKLATRVIDLPKSVVLQGVTLGIKVPDIQRRNSTR